MRMRHVVGQQAISSRGIAVSRANRCLMRTRELGLALAVLVFGTFVGLACRPASNDGSTGEPWSSAQTVGAGDLAKEMSASSEGSRPTVIYVGFRSLYRGGHIPGAVFIGPALSAEGTASLRRWAESAAKSTNVVVYCGCCPLAECPNVRPAFTILRDLGFTHVRVLVLPNSFAADWLGGGYPVER